MWFSKKPSREDVLLEALQTLSAQFHDAFKHQSETHLKSVETIAAANIEVAKGLGEQAKSFSNWIDSFKVAAQPTARVMNDETMVALEEVRREALKKDGFPVDGSPRQQAAFVGQSILDLEKIEAELFG